MIGTPKASFISPSTESYVESALKTVGIADETAGYFYHTFMILCFKISDYFMPSMHREIALIIIKNSHRFKSFYDSLIQ
jgi:hypothetical protein